MIQDPNVLPELERAKRLIRKLDERTQQNGCTEHEAMEAAEKIGQLLSQFDLQLSDVLIKAETCVFREVYADDDTAYGIVAGIARLCSLRHYHKAGSSPPTYVLYGFERDMELALYLYEVCMEALANDWGTFTREHGYARKKRDSFRMGFGQRVRERLVAIRKKRDQEAAERAKASTSRDLVLVRDAIVEEEFQRTGIKLVAGRSRRVADSHAYGQGHAAGGRVSLNTGIGGGSAGALR